MNYAIIQKKAADAIKKKGALVTFMRNGSSIGKTYAIEATSVSQNDTKAQSSLMAQTSLTAKQLIVAVMKNAPQVDDTVIINKSTYTITSVIEFSPAGVPLYYRVEAI